MSDPEHRLRLVKDAERFLQAGGVLTWSEWVGMDFDLQAAFVVAGKKHQIDQAIRIGSSTQGVTGILRTYSEWDGGEAHDSFIAQQAGAMIAERLAQEGRRAP